MKTSVLGCLFLWAMLSLGMMAVPVKLTFEMDADPANVDTIFINGTIKFIARAGEADLIE